jgi:hypothetical protein
MQPAIALIIAGVILGMPAGLYSLTHPRREGEPIDAQRKALLGLSFLGLLLVPAGGVMFSMRTR